MVTLNNLFESYSVRPLNEGETIQSFNCGDTELNDFIINRAAKYRDELRKQSTQSSLGFNKKIITMCRLFLKIGDTFLYYMYDKQ
jgi:hypothetical protein